MKRFSFGKDKRLVSDKQFKAVLAHNLRISNGMLILYMAENDCGYPRLGVSVGRFCGNAVVRNRWKRLLREAFRQSQDQIPAGFDYLLMISPEWPKKVNKTCPELAEGLIDSKETMSQPTFERVKGSFLTLVAAAAKKIGLLT